jgi:hypothetical protein
MRDNPTRLDLSTFIEKASMENSELMNIFMFIDNSILINPLLCILLSMTKINESYIIFIYYGFSNKSS